MGKWLFDIIRDGSLTDNQHYNIKEDSITATYYYAGNELSGVLKKKGQGVQKKHHKNTWVFINNIADSINGQLTNIEDNKLLIFHDAEYEHNSDDPFVQVHGISDTNFTLTTGNIIGHVKKGDHELKISSRFGDAFLREIIADTDGFLDVSKSGGEDKNNGYEWLLIYLWNIKLRKAYRLGLPKAYRSHRDVLSKVKGCIDPLDYYLHRKQGKYQCDYREHTYNIPAVQLIMTAIKKVSKNTAAYPFTRDLHSINQSFITATKGEVLKPSEISKVKYFDNPYYSDYNSVIDLSKMILRDEWISFGAYSDTSAFLFDVSMLFEYFIRKTLIRKGYYLHDKFAERKEIATCSLSSYKRKLEPDLVIEDDTGITLLDVKYKNYDFKFGVKREDLFQLHTYLGQYGNAKQIKHAGFVYPIKEGIWQEKLNGKRSITDEIVIMDHKVPFSVFFFVVPDYLEIQEEGVDANKYYSDIFQKSVNEFIKEFSKNQ